MGAATAAIVGGVIAAGGAIAGSAISSSAADDAANTQAGAIREGNLLTLQGQREAIAAQKEATEKATALFREYSDRAYKDLAPYRAAQNDALVRLQGMINPDDSYYNQQRDIATTAVQRQLAAQGLLRSKKQVDLLSGLEADLTRQKRDYTLNVLGSLSGTGAAQNSASLLQSTGQQLAGLQSGQGNNLSSIFQNTAGALAGGARGIGAAYGQALQDRGYYWGSAIQNTANSANSAYNNYLQQQQNEMLNNFFMRGVSTPPPGQAGWGMPGFSNYA